MDAIIETMTRVPQDVPKDVGQSSYPHDLIPSHAGWCFSPTIFDLPDLDRPSGLDLTTRSFRRPISSLKKLLQPRPRQDFTRIEWKCVSLPGLKWSSVVAVSVHALRRV